MIVEPSCCKDIATVTDKQLQHFGTFGCSGVGSEPIKGIETSASGSLDAKFREPLAIRAFEDNASVELLSPVEFSGGANM